MDHNIDSNTEQSNNLNPDETLFRKCVDLLTCDGESFSILHERTFNQPFDNSDFDDLKKFMTVCNENACYTFSNEELERLKQELNDAIYSFIDRFMAETFIESDNTRKVPLEKKINDRELYDRIVSQLHSDADNVINKYDNFIQEGRQILGISLLEEEIN